MHFKNVAQLVLINKSNYVQLKRLCNTSNFLSYTELFRSVIYQSPHGYSIGQCWTLVISTAR